MLWLAKPWSEDILPTLVGLDCVVGRASPAVASLPRPLTLKRKGRAPFVFRTFPPQVGATWPFGRYFTLTLSHRETFAQPPSFQRKPAVYGTERPSRGARQSVIHGSFV